MAFGYAMYHNDESPRQAWQRIITSFEKPANPKPKTAPMVAPASTATPVPTVSFAATPTPVPALTFSPAPTPAPVDPIAWLISHKNRWPHEVVLLETTEFPAMLGGKTIGSVEVPLSSKVSVTDITAESVFVQFHGAARSLPHKATNLGELAKAAMESAQHEPPADGNTTQLAESGLDAWTAVDLMTPGINIGNTFDNVVHWETGWGSPIITKGFIQSLARTGFKSVRLPVAWDTFSDKGRITPEEFGRIDEVVNWIIEAGMFCVVNIHWDGGWIDSGVKERYPDTFHTFSPEAEKKFRSYWEQIARHFAGKNEKLLFEALNEETDFENEGSEEKAFATLTRVNQIFIDTVRKTGGNNAQRLLIVIGYSTNFEKTSGPNYHLPKDTVPGKLLVSVHYYAPWTFVGLSSDASWGKMQLTWGTEADLKALNDSFDKMKEFCARTHVPAYIGEFSMCSKKEKTYSDLWTQSVFQAALKRKMVPVLWDIGGAISRREPYAPSEELVSMLRCMEHPSAVSTARQ